MVSKGGFDSRALPGDLGGPIKKCKKRGKKEKNDSTGNVGSGGTYRDQAAASPA
jgi:hypothetical protein